ncbi:MAG: diguanylate cyclase domain-containing protein [Pseudomonadota bacterium]
MAGFAPPPLPDVELPTVAWPPRLLGRARRVVLRLLLGCGPMRSHVLQVLVAGQLYAVCSAVALHAAALGVLPARVAALLAAGMGLTFALHYALVRSGRTARLADPVLGGPMAVVNLLLCVAGYVLVGEVRGNLLILMAQTQLLAMFRMAPRRLVPLGMLGCGLLGVAAAGLSLADPQAQPWAVTATHLGTAIPALLATAFITRWIGEIRERLHTRAAELRRVLGEVQQLATHDALTGLLNRRVMDERLPALARRCLDEGRPLSVAVIDIDHFKRINDGHGHAGGDAVLASVAGVLARACPQPSLAARWGGEEFLVAWPGLGRHAAAEVVDWVRRQLQLAGQAGPLPAVTVSVGLAERREGEPLRSLVERADTALYRAKSRGRDCCVIDEPAAPAGWSPAPPPASSLP